MERRRIIGRDVVLVRVSGRDSYGSIQKDRAFCHADGGRVWITGSAIAVNNDQTIFCTTSYLLTPFLDKNTNSLRPDTQIEIMKNDDSYTWKPASVEQTTKIENISRSISQLTKASSKWKIGWLLEDGESRMESFKRELSSEGEETNKSPFIRITPPTTSQISESGIDSIIFLKLQGNPNSGSISDRIVRNGSDLPPGTSIFTVGTPFGVNSPPTFLNCITQGIVSNQVFSRIQTEKNEPDLWLIDARISPGVEGGAMYTPDGKIWGMILPPIRRTDDVVAFNLVVPMAHIPFEIMRQQLQMPHEIIPVEDCIPTAAEKARRSLVLLKHQTSWTSGFFISEQGHILTNAHLFASRSGPYSDVRVRIDYPRPGTWRKAKIIFIAQSAVDIALLQLMNYSAEEFQICEIEREPLRDGTPVIAIGHGIWGSNHQLQASITKGILSRVVKIRNSECMLLTDIAIHKGNSGGMIIDAETGKTIGIAAFNGTIRKPGESNTLTMPKLNFSIPISYLSNFFDYCSSQGNSLSLLECFNDPPSDIRQLWNLEYGGMKYKDPPVAPKYTKYIQGLSKL